MNKQETLHLAEQNLWSELGSDDEAHGASARQEPRQPLGGGGQTRRREVARDTVVAIRPGQDRHVERLEAVIRGAVVALQHRLGVAREVDGVRQSAVRRQKRPEPRLEILRREGNLEAVLLGERHRLMLAKPGERNHTLNVAAYRLGKHVAAERLTYEQAESWLIATASQSLDEDLEDRGPLTEAEILATVRSGLDAGVRNG